MAPRQECARSVSHQIDIESLGGGDLMLTQTVLRELYELEKPILQRNDWPSLRVAISDLAQRVLNAYPATSAAAFDSALRELRLQGKVMLLPPWEEVGTQALSGTM